MMDETREDTTASDPQPLNDAPQEEDDVEMESDDSSDDEGDEKLNIKAAELEKQVGHKKP